MFREIKYLILTLLRMRSWRQILIVPIAVFSVLGITLCHSMSSDWISSFLSRRLVTSHQIKSWTLIPDIGCNTVQYKEECALTKKHVREYRQQKKAKSFFNCASISDCFGHVYNSMFSNKKVALHFVDFKHSRTICQTYNGDMIECTFTAAVATLAKFANKKYQNWFHVLRTFQQIGLPKNQQTFNQFICQTKANVFNHMPKAIAFQMTLLTSMVSIYTLLATVSCMHDLKSRGFLQLMVRKGLLPFAYWASVWILVILETVLLSCGMAASYYLLCPGFFTIKEIFYSGLITAIYLLCTNAIILLITVLSNSFYTITKWVLLYMALSIFSILGNRLAHEFEALRYVRTGLLLLPWANVAEQIYANFSGKFIGLYNNYYTIGLLANSLIVLVLWVVTLYLENFVNNGYPWSHPFGCAPSDNPLPIVVAPQKWVELPESSCALRGQVFVRIVGISPKPQTLMNGSISVDFYKDQIAAIYCEDIARNNWLLSALTGRVHAEGGTVWVNGCISNNPGSRLYNHTSLGECLQEDTLCHSLTVQHTLQMALVSCSASWVESDMNILLTLLRLSDTLTTTVGNLSPSQRRKLCIALALIGNPKLIILNDPTRGLDTLSRQRFWHLLQLYRPGRCIIFSTQFIDETDRFADHKVFLSPKANFVLFAGSSKFIRGIGQSDAVLCFTLESKDKSEAVTEVCRKNMSLGGRMSLDKDQLSIFLTTDAESTIPGLIRALRSVEKDILTVGLHHAQLSSVYKRLKDLTFSDFATSARVSEHLKPGNNVHVSMNSTNNSNRQVELNWKSQRTLIGAISGIFLFNWTLLCREWTRPVNRILLIVLLLVIHGVMHAMETRVARTGSTVWTNATITKRFTRAICVTDEDAAPESKLQNQNCSDFFSGAATAAGRFVTFMKPLSIDINAFLLQHQQLNVMYAHCNQIKEGQLPCPIVYSSNWYKQAVNLHREVSVGSFSRYGQYRPQDSIGTIYTVYKAMLVYFLKLMPPLKSEILLFIDFRNFQLNIYGAYTQMFIFTVLPALFLDDIVEHKASKWRSYLASVGVNGLSYWAGILPLQWLPCFVAYGLSVCISIAVNPSVFLAVYQLVVFLLTATLGLVNNLMLAYLLTLFVPLSRRTYPLAYLLGSVFSIVALLFVQAKDFASYVAIIAWPPFASVALTYYSVKVHVYAKDFNSIGRALGVPKITSMFGQNICLIAMPIQTVVLAIMLSVMAILRPQMNDCYSCIFNNRENKDEYVNVNNPDVVLGDQCAKIVAKDNGPILLKQLKKSYAKDIDVLRSITLGVESKDFLAIVGPNASGLTTIVRTILGKILPTNGKCQVHGGDGVFARGSKITTSGLVAYTPQWDPLFAETTVEEHLRFYARVHGASAGMAQQVLEDSDLTTLRNEHTGQLTHGQRRRLCVAISLLSCSPLLLIDDASTGMSADEVAHLWRSLSKNFNRYLSGVLTAHSLTGPEAIGCRVAIIDQGLVEFLGTVEQFQQQHKMHIIELEFESSTVTKNRDTKISLLQSIFKRFFSASVLDQTMTYVKVFVPDQREDSQFESLLWLLKLKEHFKITDLTFYPATVDQTLQFVYKNHEAEVQRLSEAQVNPDAAPLSFFYESYHI